jgi:UrcA family protein
MNTFIKPLTLVMALTIPALASATVNSGQLSNNQVRITYTFDDVTTAHGRLEMERKDRSAAEKICGPQRLMGSRSVRQLRVNRSCFTKTVDETLVKLSLRN